MDEINKEEEIFEETDSTSSPQEKISFKNKLFLLALFGALLGFVIKTEAAKRFTIGFEDYKIGDSQKIYDISQMEKIVLKRNALLEKQRIEEANKVSDNEASSVNDSQNSSCQGGEGETCKP